MKSLVVYYSRSNITKKLAFKIANEIDADTEEIKSKVNYNGRLGYAKAIKDAVSNKIIDLEPFKYNPKDYDVVYLGGPVWASKAANPLISYIKLNENNFNNVKFFLTAGSSGFESSFKQLEEYSKKPLKTLAITTKEVKTENYSLSLFIS